VRKFLVLKGELSANQTRAVEIKMFFLTEETTNAFGEALNAFRMAPQRAFIVKNIDEQLLALYTVKDLLGRFHGGVFTTHDEEQIVTA